MRFFPSSVFSLVVFAFAAGFSEISQFCDCNLSLMARCSGRRRHYVSKHNAA